MANIPQNFSSMCAALDSVDFLQSYGNTLTNNDLKKTRDLCELARIVLRRKLGILFKKEYEIRKNSRDYSIRCNDPNTTRAVILAVKLLNFRNHLYLFDKQVLDYVKTYVEPLWQYFDVNMTGYTYMYAIRNNEKLFIYVPFNPIGVNELIFPPLSTDYFDRYSLRRRLESVTALKEALDKAEIKPLGEKLLRLATRLYPHGVDESIHAGIITEQFLDYCMNMSSYVTSVARAYSLYRAAVLSRQQNGDNPTQQQATQTEQEHRTERRPASVILRPVNEETQSVILRLVNEETQNNDVSNIQSDVHPCSQEQQMLFNEAWARIIENREREWEGQCEQQQTRYLQLMLSSLDSVTQEDYSRFASILASNGISMQSEDSVLCDEDIVDSIDDILDGVYFTVNANGIVKYFVYADDELIIETEDHDTAINAYPKGKPEMLRFLDIK